VTSTVPASVDPRAIQEVLDGRWAHVRRDARENLRDPDFLPVYGENVPEARERVSQGRRPVGPVRRCSADARHQAAA
jgi:acyl-CoA oxidase